MIKLFDSFVMWFNGLFGLEYAGYSWVSAIVFIVVSLIASYYILRAAIRPLLPLFGAEHSKIGAERPDIEKGVREAHRADDSFAPVQTSLRADEEVEEDISQPFIQILPMEDFNHICPEGSKLAGLLADGLADVLMDIPQVDVERSRTETMDAICDAENKKFVISGTVKARDEDMVLSIKVRDTLAGDHVWAQSLVCAYDKMPDVERECAVEIASAVIQRHRQRNTNTQSFISTGSLDAQSNSTYQSGRRPSPALPRKTGRQAM